jgi:ribosomal protein S24E
MELAVKDKKENKALQRDELTCEVGFEKAMPSRKQLREAICAATGVPAELLVIVSAKGAFGNTKAVVLAHAYKDKKAMGIERRHLLVRDGLMEKAKKAEKKAAPAKK